MPLVDFGILAALPEEFLTNKTIFTNLKEITENADSWYRTSVKAKDGKSYEVVASFMTDMGPLEAQDLTAKMIKRWDPAYIILVGIAGSFSKDARLGDVVVSQQIFHYDPGKTNGKRIEYRPQGYPCSMTLIRQHEALMFDTSTFKSWQDAAVTSAAEKLKKLKAERKTKQADKKKWAAKKKEDPADHAALKAHRPKVHFGTVASGNLVVASRAKQRELLALHGKIFATEMEGAGVLHATFRQGEIPTPSIVVKGISDAADKGKAEADELVYWRELAAENSARLALAVIKRGRIRPLKTDQFELDLYRGDIADARERIKEISLGMSLLAFPRLVKLLGPLTGLQLSVAASGAEGPLEVINIVVEYQDRQGQQQRRTIERDTEVEIAEPITGGKSVYISSSKGRLAASSFRRRAGLQARALNGLKC
jgi:nucleoside phosphorylase